MSCLWVVRDLVGQNLRLAERVHECGATRAGGTYGVVGKGNATRGEDTNRRP